LVIRTRKQHNAQYSPGVSPRSWLFCEGGSNGAAFDAAGEIVENTRVSTQPGTL
jgi:hypothetical protein